MDSRREQAIRTYIETIPTTVMFAPTVVAACNLGARTQQVTEVISHAPITSLFEMKYVEALGSLATEEIEQITTFFANQPSSLLSVLLKWASALAWATTELKPYIDSEHDRLLNEGLAETG